MARRGSKVRTGFSHALRLVTVVAVAVLLVPLGVPVASAGVGEADTYWVDATAGSNSNPGTEAQPFSTITYAASVADGLDTIMVRPGNYNTGTGEVWPVVLDGESLVGVGGRSVTTLQGDGDHQTLVISGWTAGDRLEGLTITGGGMPGIAAAVQVGVTSSAPNNPPRISDCGFSANKGGSNGGAMWASCTSGATLVVERSTFTANTAASGGAMAGTAYGSLVLRDNTLSLNGATSGGAMNLYAGSTGSILVERNTFLSNAADNAGGAIYWGTGSLSTTHTLQGNVFTANTATIGGALYLHTINLAITANKGAENWAVGGQSGFAYLEDTDVLAESNYLTGNMSPNNGSVWTVDPNSTLTEINDTLTGNYGSPYVTYAPPAATLHVLNCIYWNESTSVEIANADNVAYTCSSDDYMLMVVNGCTVGVGMVYTDPQFDGANLPALLDSSPCIDAGGPWDAPAYDFFGTAIPQDGNGDRVKWADIGCYEAPGVPLPTVYPVYRFYNFTNNTHFFTDSAEEADHVIATWPNVYRYEGIAYYTNPLNNTQPLYRFYNRRSASHFYTASAEEAAHIMATWPDIFSYDGQTYSVSPVPVPYSYAVFRFYNKMNGSHFYTASAEEAYIVNTNWPHIYTDEGPAFWIGQ